jgi:hypothetical protein
VPTVIETPHSGTGYTPGQLGTVEGRAEPSSVVRLYYLGTTPNWVELGQVRTDQAGRFGFKLAGFPPGSYRLRARCQTESGQSAESTDVLVTVVAEPEPARRSARRPRR